MKSGSRGVGARLAIVTGGTSGIGWGFARALAAAGTDLLIVARDRGQLSAACRYIETDFGVSAYPCAADLSLREGVAEVTEALHRLGRHACYLVNSAGSGSPQRFEDTPWSSLARLVDLHCHATANLCHVVIPEMRRRGFGRIINIASLSATISLAGEQEMYSASKAFVIRLSSSLNRRLKSEGVYVTAVCPGLTRTRFHVNDGTAERVRRIPGIIWLEPDAVAAQSLRWNERGRELLVPGRINNLVYHLLRKRFGIVG
ncbi:MAG TPA: SDR family NAD(P)-dependent oxidoreductase [Allosphingosinicella sp.]|jgi:hypothetical protein